MSSDLRISSPVKSGDPLEVGPLDGILVAGLVSDCQMKAVTGTEKLVQQIYLEIVNDPLPDGTGSGLATDLTTGPPDEGILQSIAAAGVNRIRANILGYQRNQAGALPADELLSNLRLVSFTLNGNNFDLRLEVTTVSGEVTITPLVVSL
jgi:hypothetical protein